MKTLSSLRFAVLALMLTATVAKAEPARYMRHPALSPDNQQIAFAYKGDIWKVSVAGGRAQRLTIHPERDQRPVWSPDGRQIAFASARAGQNDVYTISADGGPAQRLTFNTGNDFPCDWSPDGKFVLAETYRVWRPDLEEIPVAGGPARPVTAVPQEGEYFGRYSRDGKKIVFCDGGGYLRWWWEDLKSGRSGQVWTLKRDSWPPQVERVSPEGFQFLWPGFSGRDIIATSNASDFVNLVKFEGGKGEPVAVTNDSTASIKWFRLSKDGKEAVFERDFRLWHMATDEDSAREVVVEAPSDWVVAPRVEESIKGKVEEYVVSADGKKIALIARGEVYLIPAEDPERALRLTHTDARERFVQFSPDGKILYYVSDRTGRQNLYSVDTKSGRETQLTSVTDADVAKPQVSPKGDIVAFYLDNNRIASISAGGGVIDTILIGRYFDFPLESSQEFKFSPDGNYLAFTAFGTEYNTDIWVHDLAAGRSYNTTRLSRYNYDPSWSPDGKYLTFSHFLRGETQNLYALRLDPEIPEFALSKLDSLYEKAEKKDKDKDDDDALPEVKIDFEMAHQRWEQIYPMTSGQWNLRLTPDGKYWLFLADMPSGNNIWRVPADSDSDDKPMQLTSGKGSKSNIQISDDSKWVYFIEGGKIGRVGIDGKKQKSLSFAADYDYHTAARQKQKLDEVWRILGNYFYDPQLHGAAWDSLHQAYTDILDHVALEDELRDLMKEFIGSLNASHLNVYGGVPGLSSGQQSGYLGVTWDVQALKDGLYRLQHVMRNSPIDKAQNDAVLGSELISVNGHMLDSATTLDALLQGTIGERVRLEFSGGPEGAYSLDVKPVSKGGEATLVYEDFVESRRHFVDSVSEGRLGYLHVRSMNQTGLDRFMRELADQSSSFDGLIVDVRYNGGGWISVHLLGMLQRDPFVLRNFRGAETVSENKNRAFAVEKPMIMLQNHFSASNSEIFAEGWRTLGLGKIVGYPSSAAVIGTSAYRLIDGTICRRPSWGAYALDMENLEGNSRQPDIKVFNTQNDWVSGRDPQLKAAIDELLSELR